MSDRVLVLPADVSDGFSREEPLDIMPAILPSGNRNGALLSEDGRYVFAYVAFPEMRDNVPTMLDLWSNPSPHFTVDGNVFSPHLPIVNSFPVFHGGMTRYGCIFNGFGGWKYVPDGLYEPREWLYSDGITFGGDAWWDLSGAIVEGSVSWIIRATPRGTYRNSLPQTPVVELHWPRWSKTAGSGTGNRGVYEPVDGATGTFLFGLMKFVDDDGYAWIESMDGKSFVCSVRGLTLTAGRSMWTTNPLSETDERYYIASGISREGGANLYLTGEAYPPDPTQPGELHLTFAGMVAGSGTSNVFMAEAAQWRP